MALSNAERLDLSESFRLFAEMECRGSSPLYEHLSYKIAEDSDLLGLMAEAKGSQRRPNLLFAAVHFLLLAGVEHPLRRFYPSLSHKAAEPEAFPAFREFCLSRAGNLTELISARLTQTNEVRRSGQLLLGLLAAKSTDPLVLIEVGASGGLNLSLERYFFSYGDHAMGDEDSPVKLEYEIRGPDIPLLSTSIPQIAERVGIDINPLDVRNDDDARWLCACVWPEHAKRRQLLEASIAIAREHPPRLIRGDAIQILPEVIDSLPSDCPICVVHSATLAYFQSANRKRFAELLVELSADHHILWVSEEGPGAIESLAQLHRAFEDTAPPGAFFLLGLSDLRDGHRTDRLLARCDPHGRWIEPLPALISV